jgi:Histidine kinase-, DNA gyrase B-, and HSP90-like ATPase
MPKEEHKYEMRMSLEVLKHLGFNLYSNIPAVLSEVVANAYDADSDKVTIEIEDDKITIKDDGNGMNLADINDKFLLVGYQKRKDQDSKKDQNGTAVSHKYSRPLMGRKGIGKLSLFSIADNIEIHTTKGGAKNGFILNRNDIEKEISTTEKYHPKDIPLNVFEIEAGTRIIITQLKRNVTHTEVYLRKRIAKRFSVIGEKFKVIINNTPVGIEDRDYFKKLQFFWLVGNEVDSYSSHFNFEKVNMLEGNVTVREKQGAEIVEKIFSITGWIGTAYKPAELEQETINNNKLSIICRGKLWLEDILKTYNESGLYATYLIGEIKADFLDLDEQGYEDIATSSRQSIKEDDPRYVGLSNHLYTLIKEIKKVWGDMRHEAAKKTALQKATEFNPALSEWFKSLKTQKSRDYALSLFATIDTFHFDKSEELEKKKILYVQGIMAFEKLRLKDSLEELVKLKNVDDIRLSALFTDLNDIEATMYYDIAEERVSVIREFRDKLDVNEKEKIIQKHLFKHLWLLNPSWERATEGTELMEQRVKSAFDSVVSSLSKEEQEARFDIKYRAAGGKHIIIELKRFHPTYKITVFTLAEQVNKYKSALSKCLESTGYKNPHIETIIVLGDLLKEDSKIVDDLLRAVGSRVIYYDELIDQSLLAYQTYLDKQKESSRIKTITNKILGNLS